MTKRIGIYNWANASLSKRVLLIFISGLIAISGSNGQGRPDEILKNIEEAMNAGDYEMPTENLNTLAFITYKAISTAQISCWSKQ